MIRFYDPKNVVVKFGEMELRPISDYRITDTPRRVNYGPVTVSLKITHWNGMRVQKYYAEQENGRKFQLAKRKRARRLRRRRRAMRR